jgi:hypothetical protein
MRRRQRHEPTQLSIVIILISYTLYGCLLIGLFVVVRFFVFSQHSGNTNVPVLLPDPRSSTFSALDTLTASHRLYVKCLNQVGRRNKAEIVLLAQSLSLTNNER